MNFIIENKEFIMLTISVMFLIITIVVRITPTKKDDEILDRFIKLLRGIEANDIVLKIEPKKKNDDKVVVDDEIQIE